MVDFFEIPTESGKSLKVDAFWLRDNCRCNQCYDWKTFERQYNILKVSEKIEIVKFDVHGDDLTVTWNDNHLSEYSIKFLEKNVFENAAMFPDMETPIYWDKDTIQGKPVRVEYNSYMSNDDLAKTVVKSLINYGVAFIENVPPNMNHTEFAIRRLFPIHKTFFGEMWEFSDSAVHSDSAYSNSYLKLHNDQTYFNDGSALQILHCTYHDGEHGENFLVDAFKVCKNLRVKYPDTYKRLCTTLVPTEYVEKGRHFKHTAPIIVLNPLTNQVERIRYNTYDRCPMNTIPMSQMRQFYQDLKVFEREIDLAKYNWWFKLNPGTVMIFDNWRLLHGRNFYTGKRTMTGCHIMRSEYLNVARIMGLIN